MPADHIVSCGKVGRKKTAGIIEKREHFASGQQVNRAVVTIFITALPPPSWQPEGHARTARRGLATFGEKSAESGQFSVWKLEIGLRKGGTVKSKDAQVEGFEAAGDHQK